MKIIQLEELKIELYRKSVKNINIRVNLTSKRIRVSAPNTVTESTLLNFLYEKIDWMRQAIKKVETYDANQEIQQYQHLGNILFLGKQLTIHVHEKQKYTNVNLSQENLVVRLKNESSKEKIKVIVENWYKNELIKILTPLIKKYEPLMGVKVNQLRVSKAKTRWGSCQPATGRIMLNLDLIRHPISHLECVLVHEMVHLLEASHNQRFKGLMTRFYPSWKNIDQALKKIKPID